MSRVSRVALFLVLTCPTAARAGCFDQEVWYNGSDDACDGGNDFDQDGDGFVHEDWPNEAAPPSPFAGDCLDSGTATTVSGGEIPAFGIHPLATEVYYDGVDQDCDGASDFDADGDGYDSDAHGGTDCDDADPDRHPAAGEACENGPTQVDDDCDGDPHTEGGQPLPPALPGATTSWADTDGDGWGAGAAAGLCAPVAGWVTNGDDCDDTEATTHPLAPEQCDAVDNDCDGEIDEPYPGHAPLDCVEHAIDGDDDGYGWDHPAADRLCICPAWVAADAGGCNGGIAALSDCWAAAGDCDDTDATVHPGATEAIDGADGDCDGTLPAVELDCDDDGAWPDLGTLVLSDPTAAGLAACTGLPTPALTCFDAAMHLQCGADGFWAVATADLETLGVFAANERVGQDTSCDGVDCDDTCPRRCEGLPETCDGIDSDCDAGEPADLDDDGLPDAMVAPAAGAVDPAEAHHDGDGELDTSADVGPGAQTALAPARCEPLPVVAPDTGEPAPTDTAGDLDRDRGCGCAAAPGFGAPWPLLLLALRRRGRRAGAPGDVRTR